MGISEPSLLLFLGRLHPLVLHFPVALLIAVVIVEVFARFRGITNSPIFQSTIYFILIVGALSAAVTAAMGWSLAHHGGYVGDTIYWHKRFGLAVALLAILALLFKRLSLQKKMASFKYAYTTTLFLCVSAIFVTGHYGGMLTHGNNFLSSAAPEPMASWLGKTTNRAATDKYLTTDTFTTQIEPILKHYCYQCHGESKQQGGLNLSKQDMALAGGDSGVAAIAPGLALNSEAIRRLFMVRENKKAMPPDGKPRPKAEELVALMDWIENGAPWAGEASGPRTFLADMLGENAEPADATAIEMLRRTGASVKEISKTNPLLMVNLSLYSYSPQQLTQLLAPLKHNIAWLNLSNNKITEEVAELISECSQITQLILSNSDLNDDIIAPIAQLKHLVVLNLTSNEISIDGVNEVIGLPRLEVLYLWKNPIETEQLDQLKLAYPSIKITSNIALVQTNASATKRRKTPVKTSTKNIEGVEL